MAALQKRLRAGDAALGLVLNYPAPGIIECMGAGWDWLWIDGQHGQMDYQSMLQCVRTAEACGLAPIPRVSGHEVGTISLVMDMRPAGMLVPMVDTVEQAMNIVEAVYFPPLGKRSFGGRRVVDVGGRDYCQTANDDTLLVMQIETPEGAANAEAIAALDGVDALFVGPDDTKVRLGIPINTRIAESDELARMMEGVAKAARNAGKFVGCPVGDLESFAMVLGLGYRLMACGGDVPFLRTMSAARLKELRQAVV